MKKITIIGAGLAGTLLSIYLARRGYEVDVYESRPDLRKSSVDGGRSINMALSCRGITSLQRLGLMDEVNKILVPMRARAIHEEHGEVSYQAFGRHQEEYINAVMRKDLNALLLNETDSYPKIHLQFEMKLIAMDLQNKSLHLEDKTGQIHQAQYQHVIGADGASSKVRDILKHAGLIHCEREFLKHGYKELSISRTHSDTMKREHLHLWPRDSFMLLGNPNRDDSITGSLFLPHEGKHSFEMLNDEGSLLSFFKQVFPDAYHAMPNLVGEFFENPTGAISTIACTPWYYQDQCLLIGDAAHGIVPFFGQGMNCAFEDCRVLADLLEQHQDDWARVLPLFYTSRKANTDAVAEMSMDNYREIQRDIRDEKFNLKKQIEQELMHRYPNRYISKHVLVMFSNTPYQQALAHGQVQAEFLAKICDDIERLDQMNWETIDGLMPDYDKKLAGLQC